MPNWEKIRKEWETSKITFRALAEKHNVKEGTLKSRRSREKWSRDATIKKDTTNSNKVATKKGASPKKKVSSNKQKNRSGNPNPKNQFTKRNSAARKHGLFAKYFNETQKEIMDDFEEYSIADQLWLQIKIKFSAIIQLQRVMWVENSYDTLDNVSMESSGTEGSATAFKVAYAYEQYEAYIKAQARAMAEYRNLVKQFTEMTHDEDERKLKLTQMQANIDKTNIEIERIKAESGAGDEEEIIIVNAWGNENE